LSGSRRAPLKKREAHIVKTPKGRTTLTQRGPRTCSSCLLPISQDQKICRCGKATPYMSFDERRAYELQQWYEYRESLIV